MRQTIAILLEDYDYRKNPYFIALANGALTREKFLESQQQFYYAVDYFPRVLAILASRIPKHCERLSIIENLWDEHGQGKPEAFHTATFIRFLEKLSQKQTDGPAPLSAAAPVTTFNATLMGTCLYEDYRVAVCMLGMIERMFSNISSAIAQAVVNNGWMTESELTHYCLHKELDIQHADELFNVVRSEWSASPIFRDAMIRGLQLGAYCFDALYFGLLRSTQFPAALYDE